MSKSVLIVDDDPVQRTWPQHKASGIYSEPHKLSAPWAITLFLPPVHRRFVSFRDGERRAIDCRRAADGESNGGPGADVVLLDLNMPGVDGMAVLERLTPAKPDLPIIVLTGHGGVDTAVKAMRAGAADFLVKPVGPERLAVTLDNVMKLGSLRGEVTRLQRQAEEGISSVDIIGSNAGLTATVELAGRAAQSQIPVLIEGESGVGKELFARFIQSCGPRSDMPIITVNCGAIPENLIESLLFGHEKGSFTGATAKHIGKFQEANGGTLFLDEIGELRTDMQVKLLRALQEGQIDPVGSRKSGRCRRPADRRHQPRPLPDGRGRHVPRGPLLPHQRLPLARAAAARAQRGYPAPDRILRSAFRGP